MQRPDWEPPGKGSGVLDDGEALIKTSFLKVTVQYPIGGTLRLVLTTSRKQGREHKPSDTAAAHTGLGSEAHTGSRPGAAREAQAE